MLCVSWGIGWCWRSARPFKQRGNSFADSGGLKRGRPCTRNRDLLSESQGCPPLPHPVIIWITTGESPEQLESCKLEKNISSIWVGLEFGMNLYAGWSFSILAKYLSSILVAVGQNSQEAVEAPHPIPSHYSNMFGFTSGGMVILCLLPFCPKWY